jgi:hypothetical protein
LWTHPLTLVRCGLAPMSACTWQSSSNGEVGKHKSETTLVGVTATENIIHLSNVI